MKSFHRIVATGAVGGLAAVTVAASGAFACTAQASLSVGGGSPFVEPGQQVNLQVRNFPQSTDAAEIEITWWDVAGVQDTQVLARAAAPSFASGTTITVPSTMVRNASGYHVVATYTNTVSNKVEASAMQTVFARPAPASAVQNPSAVTPDDNSPIPATPVETAINQPVAATPAVNESTPVAASPAARNGATPTAAAGAPRTNAAAPATASTPVAPAADAQTTAAPAAALPKLRPVPAPAELWSGLDASKAPSLLDAPAPSSQSSTPVGGILAGSGILALAGAALVASRRRLALSVARRH